MRGDKVIVANVGDSRAVLSRDGRAMNLTTEHRVYGRHPAALAEIERVEATGGWVDDGRVCSVLAVRCVGGGRGRGGVASGKGAAGGTGGRGWGVTARAGQRAPHNAASTSELAHPIPLRAPPRCSRAFGDAEFKDDAGLKRMLARGVEYELWDEEVRRGGG